MTDLTPGLCLDFANTNAAGRKCEGADRLACLADLAAWLESSGAIEGRRARALKRIEQLDPTKANRLLLRAKRLREAVYGVMSAVASGGEPDEGDLETLSRESSGASKSLTLVRTNEGFSWTVTDTAPEAAIAAVALAATALLTGHDLHRVRECGNDTCGWLFLDNSKNQSRKWCDMSDCGNKMKARRHYARVKKARKRPS